MAEQYNKIKKEKLIEIYDKIVGRNKNFQKMLYQITKLPKGNVLEVGVGTGLLTEKLLRNKNITNLVLIESDSLFIKKFKEKFPKLTILRKNALTFSTIQKFDYIVMSLVYHHISDNKKNAFLKILCQNLNKNGKIVIGDVFILPYKNEKERNISLRIFHSERIKKAPNKIVKKVEEQSLNEGLKRRGEYKVSYLILKSQLGRIGFRNIEFTNVGSQKTGGYKVVISKK